MLQPLFVLGRNASTAHTAIRVSQAEAQQPFDVVHHFFQHIVAYRRMHELHDLYFVKLVQAVQAPNVCAKTTGFPAKARCEGRHFYW